MWPKKAKERDNRLPSHQQIQARGTAKERVESAAMELFEPNFKPTDARLGELAEMIFGEYLGLEQIPANHVVEAIRDFQINIGRGRNFAESAVFQEFLAETGQ